MIRYFLFAVLGFIVAVACKSRSGSILKDASSFPSLLFPIALAQGDSVKEQLQALVASTSLICKDFKSQESLDKRGVAYLDLSREVMSFGDNCIPGTLQGGNIDIVEIPWNSDPSRTKYFKSASACCYVVK